MAFLTIEPGDGLTAAERRKAGRIGPPSVLLSTSYPSLLRTAGFVEIDIVDLTAEYRVTQQSKNDETERRRDELTALIGDDEFEESLLRRRNTLEAIDDGLLARRLYVARRR